MRPNFTLLRQTHPNLFSSVACLNAIDRSELDRLLVQSDVDRYTSLQWVHLWDGFRHLPLTQRWLPIDHYQIKQILSQTNLYNHGHHVNRASFFASLSSINLQKNPMIHLLSKVINLRCQTRLFHDVCLSFMASSTVITRYLIELTVCSLLGNYGHTCPFERLMGPARILLYYHYYNCYENLVNWIQEIVKFVGDQTPGMLLVCILRDYLIYVIEDTPALKMYVSGLMQYDRFFSIVQDVLARLRHYLNFSFRHQTSAAYQTLVNPQSCTRLIWTCLFQDLYQLVLPFKQPMLDISYRRPALRFTDMVLTLRKKTPMIPLPAEFRPQRVEALDAVDLTLQPHEQLKRILWQFHKKELEKKKKKKLKQKEIKQLQLWESEGKSREEFFVHQELQRHHRLTAPTDNAIGFPSLMDDDILEETDPDVLLDMRCYLPQHYIEALKQVLIRCDPLSARSMSRSLEYLPHFNVTNSMTQNLITLANNYYDGAVRSIERIKQHLRDVATLEPHAYNMIQMMAFGIKQLEGHFNLMDLPHYIRVAQLKACKKRMNLSQTSYLLQATTSFVFCAVCMQIYSLLRHTNTVYKQNYRDGLRDACLSYLTGGIFCRRNQANHRGRCSDQELMKVPYLGKMILFRNKMIMICPQPNCGLPMVYQNTYYFKDPPVKKARSGPQRIIPIPALWNEHGPACCDCSKAYYDQPVLWDLFIETWLTPTWYCSFDQKPCEIEEAFWYPGDNIVCKEHHSEGLMKHIQRWMKDKPSTTIKNEIGKFLYDSILCSPLKKEEDTKRKIPFNRTLKRRIGHESF